ncbi:unnamed protein product [Adineta ricciae]|uniref:Uncharacterized protein n=1 Tax=Adineta ricciae TaxID=249248 RepID=A0A815Z011_ADIRI|nr:unnamed protein product [Adineta ricciae]
MTRRRKFQKPISYLSVSSIDETQKRPSRKRRRRRRHRRYRNRQSRSMNMTTEVAINALNMLQISTEPLEFIERDELTRYHALKMPMKQQPVVFLVNQQNISIDDDHLSSYA